MTQKRIDLLCMIALAVLPLILIAIYKDWIFDESYKDAWIYNGYFRNYSNSVYVKAFDGYYYGTRLPFVLPGLLFYKLFPPLLANYSFHLSVYYLGVCSVYVSLRTAVSARAGFLGALLLGVYAFYLYAVGWSYVDGMFLSLLAATMMFVILAGRTRHAVLLMCLAGGAFSAAVNTHLSGMAWVSVPVFGYFAGEPHVTFRKTALSTLWFACGFVVATLALCVVNYVAGGRFLFFGPAVQTAFALTATANPWKVSMATWVYGKYLIVPAIAAVATAVALVLHLAGAMKQGRGAVVLIASMVCTTAIMIAFELLGQPWLDYENHASVIIPMVFLGLGAVFAPFVDGLSLRKYVAFASGIYVSAIVAYAIPFSTWRLFDLGGPTLAGYVAIAATAGLLAATPLLAVRRARGVGCTTVVACIVILSALCPYLYANPLNASNPFRGRSASFFVVVSKAVDIVKPRFVPGKDAFWFDQRSVHGDVYIPMVCIYLCAPSTFSNAFPSVDDTRIATTILLTRKDLIDKLRLLQKVHGQLLILSEKSDALDQAQASLKTVGVRLESIEQIPFEESGVSFTIIFARPVFL